MYDVSDRVKREGEHPQYSEAITNIGNQFLSSRKIRKKTIEAADIYYSTAAKAVHLRGLTVFHGKLFYNASTC